MADTWQATGLGIGFSNNKSMLDVYQSGSGTRFYRIRRAYHFNNQFSAVTGVLFSMSLKRSISSSGGTSITPIPHDSNNASLPAEFSAGVGRTVGDATPSTFRSYIWSCDEPAVSAATMDEWELFVPFAEVWNAGYGETEVQPIVCRAAEGFHIFCINSGSVGSNDFEIEFTNEAS